MNSAELEILVRRVLDACERQRVPTDRLCMLVDVDEWESYLEAIQAMRLRHGLEPIPQDDLPPMRKLVLLGVEVRIR